MDRLKDNLENFNSLCGDSHGISVNQFRHILKCCGSAFETRVILRIWQLHSLQGAEKMLFKDLMIIISILLGLHDPMKQLYFCFSIYDSNNAGKIHYNDVGAMVQSLRKMATRYLIGMFHLSST